MVQRKRTAGLMTLALGLIAGTAWADNPPPETHSDDILWGRSQNFGTSGTGTGLWFPDSATNPGRLAVWLATPHQMIPNIVAPNSDASVTPSQGNIYFNLGSNEVIGIDGSGNAQATLNTGTLQQVSISNGLEFWKSQYRFFAPSGTPTAFNTSAPYTALNTFPYPYVGTWHNHFAVRAFRPGTYQFQFKLAGVTAADGTTLTDSSVYTITVRNRPVMGGRVVLHGWTRQDNSKNLIGNRVRVFVFPANSNPTRESDAIVTTDVYLDKQGNFSVPEGLNGLTDGNAYRVGLKPLTALTGVSRLLPGNITLSTGTPTNMGAFELFLGDVNGDGLVDESDYAAVTQSLYTSPGDAGYRGNSDVTGDGVVDESDAALVALNLYMFNDFAP